MKSQNKNRIATLEKQLKLKKPGFVLMGIGPAVGAIATGGFTADNGWSESTLGQVIGGIQTLIKVSAITITMNQQYSTALFVVIL